MRFNLSLWEVFKQFSMVLIVIEFIVGFFIFDFVYSLIRFNKNPKLCKKYGIPLKMVNYMLRIFLYILVPIFIIILYFILF